MTRPAALTTEREAPQAPCSRRQALALMLGASPGWAAPLDAPDNAPTIRLAISETLVSEVNLNDARAAMHLYLQAMAREMGVTVEYPAKLFETTQEIQARARKGTLDAVALNIVEYRRVAEWLDSDPIVGGNGPRGFMQYVILTKQSGKIRKLDDLRGTRLVVLKGPRMCLALDWLDTVMAEAQLDLAGRFFGSLATETKSARVILPVFFGQAPVCLTSKGDFDTMCELNPQLARELTTIAVSPPMLTTFYAFRKSYRSSARQRFMAALPALFRNPAGQQLATLFQFEALEPKGPGCLTSALAILEKAERLRSVPGAGGQKG